MHGAVPQLHDYIIDAARRLPDKDAVVCRGERLTYGELDARSNALANTLHAVGVARGDRVIVFADNTLETVVSFWGVLKANACVSIVNPLTKQDKLTYLLDDCRATAMISDAHLGQVFDAAAARSAHLKSVIVSGEHGADRLAALPGGMRWDQALMANRDSPPPRLNHELDLAAIIYTSGSTGDPKGVMLSHRNMLTAANSVSTCLEYAASDVVLAVLPLAFDYGLYQLIMSTKVGARVVLERSFTYPAKVLEVMVAERLTVLPGVPTIFAILANLKTLADHDLSSLRAVTNTAAALSRRQIAMLREMFPRARVFSMYGLTECKRCTVLPPELIDSHPDSVGRAIPNTELWIVDDNDSRVGPNTVGQLVIRGATVMRGYWEKPAATAKKLRPGPIPGERVLYTGDYCKMDGDGLLYFVGRMDDVIKSRGEKVAPKEVESVLCDLAEVKEAAVIGVDDEILGQAVKAFVVLEEGVSGVDARWIQRQCQKRLENFMVPKQVEFCDVLPKGQTGKILKTELS